MVPRRLRAARAAGLVALLAWLVPGSPAQAAAPEASTDASPRFADVFGSGMVLPHGQPLELRGRAAPRESLTLRVAGRSYRARADVRGTWRARIDPLPAGGPYRIELRDTRGAGATLEDVLAGEVWLCSGQSNMEFPAGRSIDQPDQLMQGHDAIRLLNVAHQTALVPRESFAERPAWQHADADAVRQFSAVCYFFARHRLQQTGLPMGLVNASWGGAAIEAWMTEQQLVRLPGHRRGVELLRGYRADPRRSELAFADDWVRWWQQASTMGPVWEMGVLDGHPDWRPAPLTDWRSYPDERLAGFTGNLWFSASFELTGEQSRTGATFVLGGIDEVDTTWLNGRFVANSFGYGTRREYRLEPGMLQPGTNQFSVLVTNTYAAGGMTGPAEEVSIRFDDGSFVPLGHAWRYRVVSRETGYPPRAPWESVSGLTSMFNGMIAPLAPLPPSGVIWYQGESNAESPDAYAELLRGLVAGWRSHFSRPDLPFIVVQLPNYGAVAATPADSGWARLRHAQQQVALADARVGLVVTQDLGEDDDIHPRAKHAVALRAAQVASALESGGNADGAVPVMAAVHDSRLVLEFWPPLALGHATGVGHFSLCTEDAARCVPASAVHEGSRVVVDRSPLPDAALLRHCWSDGGTCALKTLGGWPVPSFELPLPAAPSPARQQPAP